jgi:hypothetical protein
LAGKVRHDNLVLSIARLASLFHWSAMFRWLLKATMRGHSCQIRNDKADTRIKFAEVPLDLRHSPSGFLLALCRIAGASVIAGHLMWRPPGRAL